MDFYNWGDLDAFMMHSMFSLEDIDKVIACDEGEPDEQDWLVVAKLKNGKYGFTSAGCDYTGWD